VRRIPILSLRLLLLGLVTLAITLLGRWATLHQAFSCTTWPLLVCHR